MPGVQRAAFGARTNPTERINQAIEAQDWDGAQAALNVIGNDGFRERYIKSEDQAMKSRHFKFRNNSIYVVEMSGGLHGDIANGIDDAIKEATRPEATGTNHRVLKGHRNAYVDTTHKLAACKLPKLEPDCSFGPARHIGAIKPAHLRWNEFYTLKVEVGVNEGWRSMNCKVVQYCAVPGLRYVLCVFVSPDMEVRQCKLFSITNNELEGPDPALVQPIRITATSRIMLDARRLLALSDELALPGRFPAEVSFDISSPDLGRRLALHED
ncbi:hypothetical protein SPRG_08392 [Saprolegnia parasitica CBS 223.65]|uniref:Uncharacterized protein n=1 Tax=Saprolegnia parasitica (strain CBS 223.65) TaxID=695850 RepID=A0A067C6C2_SAPPC|nr:hypothetical protein SPRG_08392 [Saprolegnia parasitica CBS 223.65]KDO26319.1 hypothetical protein SPRG_08392 [Saprolegnia parasitica CBS 223.65]|eukprot:XP_012203018.1 hypothetical protein SPRG_08392 [Saprolegnia parasitica CBS 223.65]